MVASDKINNGLSFLSVNHFKNFDINLNNADMREHSQKYSLLQFWFYSAHNKKVSQSSQSDSFSLSEFSDKSDGSLRQGKFKFHSHLGVELIGDMDKTMKTIDNLIKFLPE